MTQTVGNACSDSCNVLTQNCPTGGTGQACYIDNGATSHCYGPPGTIAEAGACMFIDDCAKPLSCIQLTGDTGGKCHKMCNRLLATPANGCRTPQTCTAVNGFGNTGVCRPAMP